MKLLIIGHGRHGKDTAADFINQALGLKSESSSMICAREFIYEELKEKYNYKTFEECYEDRHNHRTEWFDRIAAYNTPNKTRLGRKIWEFSDVYIGIRNDEEFYAIEEAGLYDFCIWVDACERLPLEPWESMKLDRDMADIIIDNNGTLEQFHENLEHLVNFLHAWSTEDV